jgi:hypothetical protein
MFKGAVYGYPRAGYPFGVPGASGAVTRGADREAVRDDEARFYRLVGAVHFAHLGDLPCFGSYLVRFTQELRQGSSRPFS